ncbi:MAG TPA: hypothetical protein V6D05_16015 [Stenomitos sp.]
MQILPQIQAGGYHAQALVSPWTVQDVHHVEISVLALSGAGEESPALQGGRPLTQDLPKEALGSAFTVSGLAPHSRYRLRARAYKSAGSLPADLISTETAFVDVTVLADDRPAVATLSIPLKDVPFDGRGTAPSMDILTGHLAPVGTESLQLGVPAE